MATGTSAHRSRAGGTGRLEALRRALVWAAAALLVVVAGGPAAAARAQSVCRFAGGFAALRAAAGADVVGDCVEDERAVPAPGGGAAQQRTTRGLLTWYRSSGWAAFTDGDQTWIDGPSGLQRRRNTERFAWEADATGSGLPVRYPPELSVAETPSHPAYALYPPDLAIAPGATVPAVLALHGVGFDGPAMAALVRARASARGWAVLAPTVAYGDWRDPETAREEELRLPSRLAALPGAVAVETGVPLAAGVRVFGFSRGAQAATRLAMFYPDGVAAVAAFSAGTYTLPVAGVAGPDGQRLEAPLPFGVADLPQRTGRGLALDRLGRVPFLIGAGAADDRPDDVPRQWDAYVGRTRAERAGRYAATLAQLGVPVRVAILPGTGHELTEAMLDSAFDLFDQSAAGR
jgi:predicted esterase